MISDECGYIVGRGVPLGFSRHVVEDGLSVDFESFEFDVVYFPVVVVSVDNGHIRGFTVVTDIPERDVLDPFSRCRAVFLVESHLNLKDGTLMDVLNPNVVEEDVLDVVVVSAVDGEASLVIHLRLALTQDVDVLISESYDAVSNSRVSVDTDEYGVSHVGPKRGVCHFNVVHRAVESFSGGISCGAVVGVSAEHTVVGDV